LLHVSDSESTERRVSGEGLNNHVLLGDEFNHGGITGLNESGLFFHDFTVTFVNLVSDLGELASDVSGMAIEDGSVSVGDLTGMVHDDGLGNEHFGIASGVVLGVRADISSLEILNGEVSDIETNVITGGGLGDGLVMHLNGLDFSGDGHGAEGGDHLGLDDTGLDSTDGNCTDTGNLVDILEGESESLIGGSLGRVEIIKSVEEEGSLVPGHVLGSVDHVITAHPEMGTN